MTIDQQFIEYIIKSLVGDPDAVHVERTVDEKGVLLTLTVAPDDLGRVIGKRGTTAQSLRTLLRALGTKNDARYNLKIVDVNRPETDGPAPGAEVSEGQATEAVAAEAPAETSEVNATGPTDVVQTPVEESTSVALADDHSDVVTKTRAELEELDDLDI